MVLPYALSSFGRTVRPLVRAGTSEVVGTHAVLPQGDPVLASFAIPLSALAGSPRSRVASEKPRRTSLEGGRERSPSSRKESMVVCRWYQPLAADCWLPAAHDWCCLLPRPLWILCCSAWQHAAPPITNKINRGFHTDNDAFFYRG